MGAPGVPVGKRVPRVWEKLGLRSKRGQGIPRIQGVSGGFRELLDFRSSQGRGVSETVTKMTCSSCFKHCGCPYLAARWRAL